MRTIACVLLAVARMTAAQSPTMADPGFGTSATASSTPTATTSVAGNAPPQAPGKNNYGPRFFGPGITNPLGRPINPMVVQHAQKVLAMRPDLKVYVDFDGQMHFTNQYGIEVDEILDEFGRDLSELLDVQEQRERFFHAQQQAPFNAQNQQQAPFNTQHQHQVSFNAQSQQQVPFNPQPQQQVPFNPQPQQQVPFNPQPQQPVPFTAQHQPQAPFNIQHQEQLIQRAPNSGSEQELANAFLNKEFERRHKMLEQQLLQEYRTNPAAFTSPVRTNGGGLDGRTQTQAGRRVSA